MMISVKELSGRQFFSSRPLFQVFAFAHIVKVQWTEAYSIGMAMLTRRIFNLSICSMPKTSAILVKLKYLSKRGVRSRAGRISQVCLNNISVQILRYI